MDTTLDQVYESHLEIDTDLDKYASGYRELTAPEQHWLVEKFARQITSIQWPLKYALKNRTVEYAETILNLGLYERWRSLTGRQKSEFFSEYFDDETALTMFALEDLSPGVIVRTFVATSIATFEEFQRYLQQTFDDQDSIAEDFSKTLHRLFVQHGSQDVWGADSSPKTRGSSDKVDQLITQTALVLEKIYGPERTLAVIERMIEEEPLSPRDFIRVVQSDMDMVEIPLSWAAHLTRPETSI